MCLHMMNDLPAEEAVAEEEEEEAAEAEAAGGQKSAIQGVESSLVVEAGTVSFKYN